MQGGGITLHTYTNYFRITNNNIVGNSGSYAGGIRVGTPFLNQATGAGSSFNTHLTIAGNQIKYNGGFNLAGGKSGADAMSLVVLYKRRHLSPLLLFVLSCNAGIGLFGGSDGYVIDNNYICGNNGQEYGGAISHYGVSNGGVISNNWILWNRAFDEGGCLCIASEILTQDPDLNPADYPAYAGDVTIEANVIQVRFDVFAYCSVRSAHVGDCVPVSHNRIPLVDSLISLRTSQGLRVWRRWRRHPIPQPRAVSLRR